MSKKTKAPEPEFKWLNLASDLREMLDNHDRQMDELNDARSSLDERDSHQEECENRAIEANLAKRIEAEVNEVTAHKELIGLVCDMGKIIRELDADSQWSEYWIQDGNEHGPEYVNQPAFMKATKGETNA